MKRGLLFWLFLALGACAEFPLSAIHLPPGFHIAIYAEVPGARSLAVAGDQVVFVGTRGDKVYAVVGEKGGEKEVLTMASGLKMPNGVAFWKGDLYVAEVARILRFRNILRHLHAPPSPEVLYDKLPNKRHHGWRYLGVSPKGKLVVSIGAPCNICKPPSPFGSLAQLSLRDSSLTILARGIRNSVGFDWDPVDQSLWFTDNGRDWLGDNLPPDELNRVPLTFRGVPHFGYPYCHGKRVLDPQYGKGENCADYLPPQLELEAHVAPLGMLFYTGKMFPKNFWRQIFVAEHGSWNRRTPIGYRIILVRRKGSRVLGREVFARGWLKGRKVLGRPVDFAQLLDGSLLVSDDTAGLIYRITFKKP